MRAAVCREFGAPLEIEDLELAGPSLGEARVRVAACAICSSDVAFAGGAWGGTLPAVYGHEAAGIVEEVGPGVDAVRPGDRVVVSLLRSCGRCFFCERGEPHLCDGDFPADREGKLRTHDGEQVQQAMHTAAFAEVVVVDQSQVAVVPDSMPLDVASLLGCGVITGVGAVLDKIGVTPGSSVAVIGTGGVGMNAVQGAALAGASTIVAVDPSAGKRERALAFGATQAVDPADGDPAGALRALTRGRGVDYAFVAVGRSELIEGALGYVRRGGTVAVLGMPPSHETFGVVTVDLVHDDVRVVGCKVGAGSGRLAEAVPRLVRLYQDGRLRLDELVTARYPLEGVNDAIAATRRGDGLRNVLVLDAA
jgi:S-(hydroxymethyl)glutathione dehydrogenase/alcohol dehydrogenase